ncbi:ATP-binding protein [Streptomyces sp. YIM S03343]
MPDRTQMTAASGPLPDSRACADDCAAVRPTAITTEAERRLLGEPMTGVGAAQANDGTEVLTKVLPRTPESVPLARGIVREVLQAWELTAITDDVALVVTELAANAVQHTRANVMRLTLRRIPGGVRVAVIDKSRGRPVRKTLGPGAENGRGLALVAEISHAWGVDELPWGKRVWADCALETTDRPSGR